MESNNILKSYAFAYGLKAPDDEPMKTCPECGGLKTIPYSTCCGAEIDNGLCVECQKPAKEGICDKCKGTGKVPMDTEDLERQKHEAELDKVDNWRNE
jgi:hypothetical protein